MTTESQRVKKEKEGERQDIRREKSNSNQDPEPDLKVEMALEKDGRTKADRKAGEVRKETKKKREKKKKEQENKGKSQKRKEKTLEEKKDGVKKKRARKKKGEKTETEELSKEAKNEEKAAMFLEKETLHQERIQPQPDPKEKSSGDLKAPNDHENQKGHSESYLPQPAPKTLKVGGAKERIMKILQEKSREYLNSSQNLIETPESSQKNEAPNEEEITESYIQVDKSEDWIHYKLTLRPGKSKNYSRLDNGYLVFSFKNQFHDMTWSSIFHFGRKLHIFRVFCAKCPSVL